jgi:hypothetical protein
MLFRTTVRGNLTVVLECMVHGLDRLLGEEVAEDLGQIGPRTVVRVHEEALEDRLVPHATSCALRAAVGLLRVLQEVQGQIEVLQDLGTVCVCRTGQHLGLG